MTITIEDWQKEKIECGRKNGTVCLDCPKDIEKRRIEWAQRHGLNAPTRCETCSNNRRRSLPAA